MHINNLYNVKNSAIPHFPVIKYTYIYIIEIIEITVVLLDFCDFKANFSQIGSVMLHYYIAFHLSN